MKQVHLERTFIFRGKYYGPGLTSVPDEFPAKGDEYKAPVDVASFEVAPPETELPDNFPVRKLLAANGYTTLEAVAEATDLKSIPGVGPATLQQIKAALEA